VLTDGVGVRDDKETLCAVKSATIFMTVRRVIGFEVIDEGIESVGGSLKNQEDEILFVLVELSYTEVHLELCLRSARSCGENLEFGFVLLLRSGVCFKSGTVWKSVEKWCMHEGFHIENLAKCACQ
jgi:hypothetical protein